jgi:hypothetical protein
MPWPLTPCLLEPSQNAADGTNRQTEITMSPDHKTVSVDRG